MGRFLYTTGLTLMLGGLAAGPVSGASPSTEYPSGSKIPALSAEQLGQEFLQTSTDLWFLLSGIRDKDDADRAAERFLELVRKVFALDELLSGMPADPAAAAMAAEETDAEVVGMMDEIQIRILDSFEDLNAEFESLCRVRCYGSGRLMTAFRQAVASGMFTDETVDLLAEPAEPYSENEALQEFVRLKRLQEPDRAVLESLSRVKDKKSAVRAARELAMLTTRLQQLRPDTLQPRRCFTDSMLRKAQDAYAPLEPLLWGIRNEIVRIASLPEYSGESFDAFSEALDSVFECLGETHYNYFDSVFDASFRSDLDDALHEHATSSN